MVKFLGRLIVLVLVLAGLVAVVGVGSLAMGGIGARREPSSLEMKVAPKLRSLAIPASAKQAANPVPANAEAIADGMAHFADHCAVCHGNDGRGDTEMGRGLYPKAPDMRLDTTQQLSDGDLFYIIEHGIRFTGMPGWRTGTTAGEESSWRLVHFIRHLPTLTPAELDAMKARNPRSPEDIRFEIEEERFLNEGAQK